MSAVEALVAKLSRVVVPAHTSHTPVGKPVWVKTYSYDNKRSNKLTPQEALGKLALFEDKLMFNPSTNQYEAPPFFLRRVGEGVRAVAETLKPPSSFGRVSFGRNDGMAAAGMYEGFDLAGGDSTGELVGNIRIHVGGNETPLSTVAHEFGHRIDSHITSSGRDKFQITQVAKATPTEKSNESLASNAAELAKIAVKKSGGDNDFKAIEMFINESLHKHSEYLGKPEEIWARAFAQYIALKSRNPAMLRELRKLQAKARKPPTDGELASGASSKFVWQNEEFKPIYIEVEKRLRAGGWL